MNELISFNNQNAYLIVSWNVDGYGDDIHQWLLQFVKDRRPDVVFLSETKKSEVDLQVKFREFINYRAIINVHNPARYHGVAMLIRNDHSYEQLSITMNIAVRKETKGNEAGQGRIIAICLNRKMHLIGSYTPNSGRSDTIKLQYRTHTWDPAFFNILEQFRKAGPTMWIGDINVALDEIDISKTTKQYAGFTPEERANLRAILTTGNWVDIWRQQHPNDRVYTWCGAPPRPNYGMRLDNIIVSESLRPKITNSFMITECPISADHIPVCAEVSI
jgi:exodeoxyribonuclease III